MKKFKFKELQKMYDNFIKYKNSPRSYLEIINDGQFKLKCLSKDEAIAYVESPTLQTSISLLFTKYDINCIVRFNNNAFTYSLSKYKFKFENEETKKFIIDTMIDMIKMKSLEKPCYSMLLREGDCGQNNLDFVFTSYYDRDSYPMLDKEFMEMRACLCQSCRFFSNTLIFNKICFDIVYWKKLSLELSLNGSKIKVETKGG